MLLIVDVLLEVAEAASSRSSRKVPDIEEETTSFYLHVVAACHNQRAAKFPVFFPPGVQTDLSTSISSEE